MLVLWLSRVAHSGPSTLPDGGAGHDGHIARYCRAWRLDALGGRRRIPHSMAFGAAGRPDLAESFGRITGEEARAVGVHWNFFPVADVNSNPKNPIIQPIDEMNPRPRYR